MTGRFPRWVEASAALVLLNVCWLVASLPVVTAVGAGAALQATLHRWLEHGETRIVASFAAEFRRRAPALLLPGVAACVLVAACWLALAFWLAVEAWAAVPMIAMVLLIGLIVLTGHMVFFELAALAPGGRAGGRLRAVAVVLAVKPVATVALAGFLVTWIAGLAVLPTAVLVAGASVPAYLAHRLHHGSALRLTTNQ